MTRRRPETRSSRQAFQDGWLPAYWPECDSQRTRLKDARGGRKVNCGNGLLPLAFSVAQERPWSCVQQKKKEQENMDKTIIRSIEELASLKIPALKMRYRELFGEESKSSNKQFLFRCFAFRLQANAEGALSERARRRIGD